MITISGQVYQTSTNSQSRVNVLNAIGSRLLPCTRFNMLGPLLFMVLLHRFLVVFSALIYL